MCPRISRISDLGKIKRIRLMGISAFDVRDSYLQYFHALSKTSHLHYGLWTTNVEPKMEDLQNAQEEYVRFVADHFPDGVSSVLDIGCGVGGPARMFAEMGYLLTAITPVEWQRQLAERTVDGMAKVVLSTFEDFHSNQKFDLLLMCESAQYLTMEDIFSKSCELCSDQGKILICDYFRKSSGGGRTGNHSGHVRADFLECAKAWSFRLVKGFDITEVVVPTLRLAQVQFAETIKPTIEFLVSFVGSSTVDGMRWVEELVHSEIERYEQLIDPLEFVENRSYELLLFDRICVWTQTN